MHILYRKPSALPPAGQLLGKGLFVSVLGAALLAGAAALAGAAHPLLHAAGGALRLLAPYALVCGGAALLTWMVMRPSPASPLPPQGWPGAAAAASAQEGVHVPLHWSTALFQQLSPQGFAGVCAELFAQPDKRTRMERIDADGADLWLHPVGALPPVALVQCRQWTDRQVGVKELRELQGVMASRDVARGTFVTTSSFTGDAKVFARTHGIAMADVHDLLALVERRTPAQQRELLAFAWAAR